VSDVDRVDEAMGHAISDCDGDARESRNRLLLQRSRSRLNSRWSGQ
jgi:hypothetical protein